MQSEGSGRAKHDFIAQSSMELTLCKVRHFLLHSPHLSDRYCFSHHHASSPLLLMAGVWCGFVNPAVGTALGSHRHNSDEAVGGILFAFVSPFYTRLWW